MQVRAANHADAPVIADLFNHFIRSGTETFNSVEKTTEEIIIAIDQKAQDGHAFLLVESDRALLGFAYYGQFRGGVGYAYTYEHTVYVDPDAKGRGAGRALMRAIEKHARGTGGHTIYAGVSGENTSGIAFHERLGYSEIWHLPEVGFKFGRWIDLVLMMKRL